MNIVKSMSGVWVFAQILFFATEPATAVPRPRLFMGPDDILNLREKAQKPGYIEYYQNYKRMLDEKIKLPAEINSSLIESQMGALVWYVTGDMKYAQRAKRHYLDMVRSYRSSTERYERGGRVISLSISRNLQNLCTDFDLLEPSGLFTYEEKEFVEESLAVMARRLMEREKTFNPYDYLSSRFRGDNWNVDRVMAVGMFALTFPDDPQSVPYLDHAVEELTWILEHTLLPDGAWVEGTRYHGAVLRSIIPFAYALKRNSNIDFFAQSSFKSMLESLIRLQTPKDATVSGAALMPGIGDANWENIWEAVLGWAAFAYKESDPDFASRLMYFWGRAGSPFVVEFSPGNPIMGFLFIDTEIKSKPQPALKSDIRPGGYAILRREFNTAKESYFHLNVGTPRNPWQHQHHDRGSFSLYAWNTPLSVDPGVRDYGQSLRQWYIHSQAHNQVVFNEQDNREGGIISEHLFSDALDYVEADLTLSMGVPYRRRIFYVAPYYYLIWDEIDTPAPAVFQLHALTEDTESPFQMISDSKSVDRIRFACQHKIDLELQIISPPQSIGKQLVRIRDDMYPVRFYGERNSIPTMVNQRTPTWLQLRQEKSRQDFITILYPRKIESPALGITDSKQQEPEMDSKAPSGEAYHDSAIQFTVKVGKVSTTFYFQEQSYPALDFKGKAVILHQAKHNRKPEVLLIQTTKFHTPDLQLDFSQPVTRWISPASQ